MVRLFARPDRCCSICVRRSRRRVSTGDEIETRNQETIKNTLTTSLRVRVGFFSFSLTYKDWKERSPVALASLGAELLGWRPWSRKGGPRDLLTGRNFWAPRTEATVNTGMHVQYIGCVCVGER